MRVAVVGAGLAGLAAAADLGAAGADVVVLEAGDAVGGRVRTDRLGADGHPAADGEAAFQLDRGFQVLLTAYPEVQQRVDLPALRPGRFAPGALVRAEGRFHRVADPLRAPASLPATLRAPIGTVADKLRVARYRLRTGRGDAQAPLRGPQRTARAELAAQGFSARMVERFFRPLFGGVLLDPQLTTSGRLLAFTFRMFSEGSVVLPAEGIGALPRQLAAGLPDRVLVRLEAPVTTLTSAGLRLASGEEVAADAVVIATDGPTATRLTGASAPPGKQVACLQFAAERPPVDEPLIVLDGDGHGPAAHMSVPSVVAPGYAPPGTALVSATVLSDHLDADDATLEAGVRAQMAGWFGARVAAWRLLRCERIRYAQPDQSPPGLAVPYQPARLGSGRYLAGDHHAHASQQGALRSGALAAAAVLDDLG